MSRIQNILDKAEREGAVARVRSLPDQPINGTASVAPLVLNPPASRTSPEPDVSAPAAPAVRVVSAARLHPSLIAAMAPSGVAAEQYRSLRTRLVHRDSGGPVNVVLVTSLGRGDGKSIT